MGIRNIMDDKNSSFKFGANNGENPDHILRARPERIRSEKTRSEKIRPEDKVNNTLNKKIMFITIFLTCLIGVVLYFTYSNIQEKTVVIQKTGSEEIKKTSEHIEAQLVRMSELHQTSENAFNTKIASIEATLSSLNNTLSKTDQDLKKMILSKAGKKETDTAFETIGTTLAAIEASTKRMASELNAFDVAASADRLKMRTSIERANADLTALKTDVSQLSASKADIKKLNDVLESQRLIALKLNMLKKQIDTGFSSYDKKINDLSRSGSSQQLIPSNVPKKDEVMPKRVGDERLIEEDIK
jgi:cell division protein FtsB